jgi:hypothetical protein
LAEKSRLPSASWVTYSPSPETSGKVPATAPEPGLSTRLDDVSWVMVTISCQLAPVPTEKSAVGLPCWGSTDQRSDPDGEYLSTEVP